MKRIEKIKAIAMEEVSTLKYLYDAYLIGLIDTIFNKSGVPKTNPIPKEYFDAVKDVMEDEFYGGLEPEWETLEAYKNWQTLNVRFIYRTEKEHELLNRYNGHTCPYYDKTIPYLTLA